MSALSVSSPFPIFTDIDGQPLEAGYVWIGTANLDPQVNPIAVYWDAALTIVAVQPIRTLGGYPANSGTPARLYVDSDYSIRVMNKNGSVVYSAPAATERYSDVVIGDINASTVIYDPAGTGAVATTVQGKLRNIVAVDDYSSVNAAMNYAIANSKRVRFLAATTVRVPEDAPTVNAALSAIYADPSESFLITVSISTGHQIGVGILVSNVDLSNVQITSMDATVLLAAGFVGVNGGDAFSTNSLFVANKSKAPRWSIVVDMNDSGGGGLVYEQSTGFVAGSKGVRNSGGYGLYCKNQSSVFATNAVFIGGAYGNRVTVNSMLNAPQANFSGTKNALYVGSNSAANLDVSRGSLVYITGTAAAPTDLTGGLGRGLAVRRSFVSATNVDCSGVGREGLIAQFGAHVAFDGSIANNCGSSGVVSQASFVSFSESGVSTGNAIYNLYADFGGTIVAEGATLTGALTQGVRAANGSTISIPGANCRRNGVSDQPTDIVITQGSYITAVGALGGTGTIPLSTSVNGRIEKETAAIIIATNGGNITSVISNEFTGLSTASGLVGYFRNTNTTGSKRLIFYRGDGTGTVDAQIGVGSQGTILNGTVNPNTDNAQTLGSAPLRWSQVFAGNATINTSDAREKQQIAELTASEKVVAIHLKSMIRSFKFNDSVEAKGDAARIHFGVMAQDVKAAFEAEGLVAEKYSMLCYDEWPETPEERDEDGNITQAFIAAGNRYGIRYEEFLAFIISAL